MSDLYTAKILLFVRDPQAILDAGYDEIHLERRESPTSAWASLAALEALTVETGKYNYFFVDDSALRGQQYRVILRGGGPDIPQGIVEAVDASFEYVLTVQELKDLYLFGLDSALSDDAGVPLPDATYVHYIRSAIAKFEQKVDIKVVPTRIVEMRDLYADDFRDFIKIYLDAGPIIEVERVRMVSPVDTTETIREFPSTSWRVNVAEGVTQIVQGAGDMSQMLARSYGLAQTTNRRSFPHLFEVTYFAGWAPGTVPANVKDIIGKEASLGPLNIGGDLLVGAGIASQTISLDGLSTSVNTTSSATNAGFGARIIQYQKELKTAYSEIVTFYKGLRLRSA